MIKHDTAFKNKIGLECLRGGSPSSIARRHNISRDSVYKWKQELVNNLNLLFEEKLPQRIRNLESENTKLKQCYKIILDLNCLPTAELEQKLIAIESNFNIHPTKTMCRILCVNHSTFYNFHFRKVHISQNKRRDQELTLFIKTEFELSEERYGAEKIVQSLKNQGTIVSRRKVSQIMKELGITPKLIGKPKRIQTRKKEQHVNNRNILNRNFYPDAPNRVWASDVSTIKINKNYFFLCVIVDLFSRKIVGHKTSCSNNTNLIINTFKDAYSKRGEPDGLLFHSDRGCNYTALEVKDLFNLLGVTHSLSNPGNPYDNACVESFFGKIKKEEINRRKYESYREFQESIDDYIDFFNSNRIHQTLSYKTPNRFEAEFYDKHKDI